MLNIHFTATKLNGTGKAGILPADSNGYYTMPIGGLNVANSIGEIYIADGARELFESSSVFMRRVKSGCLKGESGHPKRTPGMSMDEYYNRIIRIEETNVAAHFAEIWLDESFGRNNPQLNNKDIIAIMAKVKPAGPNGPSLKESFDNPKEEVCFSIRALTQDYYNRGKTYRVLKQIITFDNVTEPGINFAKKWNSPSLESIADFIIKKENVENTVNSISNEVALESTRELALETLSLMKADPSLKIVNIPIIAKW